MKYDVIELKKKVDSFFSGEISRQELGEWAEKAYYDLLRGGYIENKKIVIYPFLKKISQFHIAKNEIEDKYPCSEIEIKEIQNILHGEQEFSFQVEIAIPLQIYSMFKDNINFDLRRYEIISELRDDILKYIENEDGVFNNGVKYIKLIYDMVNKGDTLQDILGKYIFRILNMSFDFDSGNAVKKENMKLYTLKSSNNDILNKLLEYLDSFLGNRNFYIMVTYQNGLSDMLLIV